MKFNSTSAPEITKQELNEILYLRTEKARLEKRLLQVSAMLDTAEDFAMTKIREGMSSPPGFITHVWATDDSKELVIEQTGETQETQQFNYST